MKNVDVHQSIACHIRFNFLDILDIMERNKKAKLCKNWAALVCRTHCT